MITTTNTYDISDSIKQWKVYWQPASLIEKGSDIWTQHSFNDILCFDVTKHKLMILNIQYNLICFDLILPNRMIGGLQILHNTWSHIKMSGDRSKPRKADLIQFLLKLFLWTVLKHEFCCRMLFSYVSFFLGCIWWILYLKYVYCRYESFVWVSSCKVPSWYLEPLGVSRFNTLITSVFVIKIQLDAWQSSTLRMHLILYHVGFHRISTKKNGD